MVEVDESYFGGVRGKHGRGAGRKTPMFLLRYPSCPSARRNTKTQSHEFIHSSTYSAKELLPIVKDFS